MKTDQLLFPILFASTLNLYAASVDLGAALSFRVLAGSGITFTGPTTVFGDIGSSPTPSITGLENLTLIGTNHAGDAFTQFGKASLVVAFADAQGRTPSTIFPAPYDLGGDILLPGVYKDASSFEINGTLVLDAQGDPNAMWIFQAGSSLTTATGSSILLTGGAQASNIFWQIGSSATLGTDSLFAGNLMALTSISSNTGAFVDGRLLAINGAVTLQSNGVVPEPGCLALCAVVMVMGGVRRKRPMV